jgi:hypothetical protein
MMLLMSLLACTDYVLNAEFEPPDAPDTDVDVIDTPVDTDVPEDTDVTPPDTDQPVDEQDTDVPVDTGTPAEDTDIPVDPAPEDDCAETHDLVYVLSREPSVLYTFDPSTLTFTELGEVDCSMYGTPASMAVSRDGFAYVRYSDDELYAVDLATMTCSSTSYDPSRTSFDSFGMGYSTDSASTWREKLYIANSSTLGTLDTSTGKITKIGKMPSQSELTGNADGELWAMLPLESPAALVHLDTTTGATLDKLSLRKFPDPSGIDTFAFATWSGNFYLFVREYGMGRSSDVYEVTPTGTMTEVSHGIGFDIVGAGVSTCAPS